MRSLPLVAALFLALNCKPANHSASGDDSLPKRVGNANDASAAAKVGVLGKGGGSRLVLDLRKPQISTDGTWACWHMPQDDFALGRAVCESDATKVIEVVGANVDLVCSETADFGTIKAKSPLNMAGCDAYDIYAYAFNPPFSISVAQ